MIAQDYLFLKPQITWDTELHLKHESSLSLRAASTMSETWNVIFPRTNVGHDGHGGGPEGVVLRFSKTQNLDQELFEFISVYLWVSESPDRQ